MDLAKATGVLEKVRAATGVPQASVTATGGPFEEPSVTVVATLGTEAEEDLIRRLMKIADEEELGFSVAGAPEGGVVGRFADGRPKFHGNRH
jgi:hypothetical protein